MLFLTIGDLYEKMKSERSSICMPELKWIKQLKSRAKI